VYALGSSAGRATASIGMFSEEVSMSVIVVFLAFVLVGDVIAVGIATVVEHFSKMASLLVFLALFISVFVAAWHLAVYITERYILRQR
jgi:hypothetical protein